MKSRLVVITLALVAMFLMNIGEISADELRNMEVIIITGNKLSQYMMDATPVDEIFVYAYDASTVTWHQIPWQIDELDDNKVGYYFGTKNGIFEGNEELLFIAQDAGDYASPSDWIDDKDSRNYARYEYRVYDELDPAYIRYVYIYRSSTLQIDPNLPSYMAYDDSPSGNDIIDAITYQEGHTEGKPTTWKIPISAGGADINILNGQKARVNAQVPILGEVKITEEDLKYNYDNISYLHGPIRVIREVSFKLKKTIVGYTLEFDLSFKKYYYPYYVEAFAPAKTLSSEWGIKLIRLSYDLSTASSGMIFYNPFNRLVIDGKKDAVDRSLIFAPDYNWFMATGDQGTYINIFRLDKIDSEQLLYYWDSENDDTYDGTYNSKLDYKSFGDTGILLRGSNMEGRLGLPMRMVYMGANQDSLVGPALVENVMNPLKYNGQEQYYQIPIIASIPDTSQQQGAFIDIPVRIDDVTGLDIRSVSFRLTYDPAIIEFRQSIQFGTMTQTWNNATVTTDDSSVQVTVSGSSALTSAGDLIKLRFKVTGAEGSTSPLDLAHFTTNNNAIAIAPTDGTLSVLAPVMIAVTLPDTSEERGLRISIPVDVSDVTGLEVSAVSFEINFNDEVLEITGIDIKNSLTASWETAYLSQIPDGAQISLSGTTFLEGSGTLLYLNFDVIGNTGDTTALELSSFRFNDGVPVSSVNNGGFTVLQPPLLAVAVPDTAVVFGENILFPISVGDADDYDVKSIQMTITYDQSVVEALSMTNEGTITSTWTDVQYTIDGGSIIASLSGEQPLTGAGELVFIELAAIGKVGDTTSIKIEEITFNKGNPEGVKDSGVITILAPTVLVSMPDTTARNGELINVPVIVDDLSGLDVMSVKLTISYDSRVLDAIGVVQQGSLSEDKGMLTFRDYPGSAYVAFMGVSPLEGSGSLFFIQFSVIGGDSSGTELVFNYVTFNNGIPKSELSNGSLTVYGTVPRVQIALPDTNGFAGRSIKIPVFVDNLSDMDVTSVAMSITYNHDVLSATGITQNGTLSAQWQTTTPELLQGKINISLTGDTPLPTGDVLVYIDFDIVGAPESTTILHFESVLFNQGIPIATTRDGIFTTVEMPVLSVTLPDTGGYRLEGLLVPVKVGYLTDYEIRSFDCTISFNQDIVNAASIIKNNSLTAGWTDVIFEEETNLIHVQMSGIEALIGEGVLFFIEMEIIGQPGDSTGLEWQQFVFNEGIPQADTRNGSMRVFSIPEIVVALPDTTVMSGTSIQIPISVDDLTDKNVQYINTMISFNPNVLRCSGIDASNSIMSQWDDVTVNLFTNRVHLIFSGEKPLTGGGTLIYLNFDVIGADSSSTTLNFMYFRFNEGIPIAIRQNGLLRIEGVIPVELATFDAQYRHGAVYLTWSTATETNNYGFEIQKSIADSSRSHHWEVIGFVKGQGTTALHHSYEFVDHEMNGETLMYRLKQIDFDGRFTIYHSVMVDIAKPSSIDLVQNYPNPFNGSTLIRYTISQPGRVSVKVFNLLGKEVATLVDENQSTGRYTIDWYAKDEAGRALSSGIYFYRLESNGYMITKKMILLE